MRVIIPSETPTSADFSRATPGTYVNEAGIVRQAGVNQPRYQDGRLLLEGAGQNLLTYSASLNTSPWFATRVTITANATTAPDESVTAEKLVETTDTGAHHCSRSFAFTAGVTYTLSAHVKAAERSAGNLRLGNGVVNFSGGVADCAFDLVAGTAIKGPSGIRAGIRELADGWYRIWITGTADASLSDNASAVFLSNGATGTYTGDGTSGMYVWGVQLEVAAEPTSYIATTTAAESRSADVLTDGYMASFEATAVGLPNQLVQEDASAAWVSGTTYAVDALVHRVETHRVYKRLVAGAGTTEPESDPTNWRDLRVTTRWAPLVMTEDTELLVIGNLHLSLPAGSSPGLYFGGIKASSIRTVVVKPDANLRSDRTHALPPAYAGWLSDGKASLYVDMSGEIYEGDRIDITLMQASVSGSAIGVAGLSYLISGIDYYLGETLQGARLGITDFSRRETDEFGTTTFVRRKFAKRLNVDVMLPTADLQRVFDLLTEMRGNVVLWVPGTSSELAPLSFFGWCKDFGLTVAYTRHATCALEIEGVI
jgi:hypothetical protein